MHARMWKGQLPPDMTANDTAAYKKGGEKNKT